MSDFQISVSHPDLPDDTEFDIQGVGIVKNGDSATVTEAMQEAFNSDTGYDLKACLNENPVIGVGKEKPNVLSGKRTPNEARSDAMAAGTLVVESEPEPEAPKDEAKEGGESK